MEITLSRSASLSLSKGTQEGGLWFRQPVRAVRSTGLKGVSSWPLFFRERERKKDGLLLLTYLTHMSNSDKPRGGSFMRILV